jgi:hypothetical protein
VYQPSVQPLTFAPKAPGRLAWTVAVTESPASEPSRPAAAATALVPVVFAAAPLVRAMNWSVSIRNCVVFGGWEEFCGKQPEWAVDGG